MDRLSEDNEETTLYPGVNPNQFKSKAISRLLSSMRGGSVVEKAKTNFTELLCQEHALRNEFSGSPVLRRSSITREDLKPTQRVVKSPKARPRSAKRSKESDILKHQDREREEHTFRPKINSRAPQPRGNFEERLEKLAAPKASVPISKEQLGDDYTFKPEISEFTFKFRPENEPIEDRLLQRGEESEQNKKQLAKEYQENAQKNCSFHPSITNEARNPNNPPIHQRIHEIQRESLQEKERIRLEHEANPDLSFKPRLNPNSLKLAGRNKEKPEFPSKLMKELSKNEARDYSFAPQTHSAKQGNFSNFLNRLEKYKEKQEENSLAKQVKMQSENNYSFKPRINPSSKALAEKLYDEDTLQSKVDRMSNFEYRKQEATKHRKQEEFYSKFTFEPQINKVSRDLAKLSSPDKLAYNHSKLLEKQMKAEEITAEQAHQCSFYPQTTANFKYEKVQSCYKQAEGIMQQIETQQHQKQDVLFKLKQKNDKRELDQCTFTPTINRSTQKTQIVTIAGYEKFLGNRELAKQKETQKKETEDKLYGLKNNGVWHHSFTVPQPFNITSSSNTDKISKLKSEVDILRMKECTFQPSTIES